MLSVVARAKINLTLDVIRRLPDGYHEIKSVMVPLALHDTVIISSGTNGITLSADSDAVPAGLENLACKAASLLQEYTGIRKPVHIHLKKNIPVAAGLAGGSTDAAAVLTGLNRFWQLGLSTAELFELGSRIGADVPFCLLGKTALASGKGERLLPLPPPPPLGVVLVKPRLGVSTATVYRLFDRLSLPRHGTCTEAMVDALHRGQVSEIACCLGNDLEPVTAGMHTEIRKIKARFLEIGALGAEMSGSGPTVFGITASEKQAREVARLLPAGDMDILVTHTI